MSMEHIATTNCLEHMAAMIEAGETVNHIITDPPYEAIMHTSKTVRECDGQRPLRTDGKKEMMAVDFAPIDAIRSEFCQKASQVCTGWLIVFCTPEGVAPWRDAIEAAGMRYKRACVWVKPDSAPQFNGQGPAMGAEMIVTAWAGPGFSKWNGGGSRGVWTHNCNPAGRDGLHPTEKPLSLMRELVRLFTNKGERVFDPFAGTGATGISALREGREFFGCEINEAYAERARLRIRSTLGDPVSMEASKPGLFD